MTSDEERGYTVWVTPLRRERRVRLPTRQASCMAMVFTATEDVLTRVATGLMK